MKFNEIKCTNTTLTIIPTIGENVTHNLSNGLSIKVTTTGDWDVIVNSNPDVSKYKHNSKIPFGKAGNLGELKFGKINSVIDFGIQTLRTSSVEDDHALAVKPVFYMLVIGEDETLGGTIGTDDMRNGKANVNVFSLEGAKDIYLKMTTSGNDYFLEVGYQSN